MDLLPTSTKTSYKKSSFGNVFLDILKNTNYASVSLYTESSSKLNLINALETYDDMKPFIEWFSESITEENCVTTEELESYNHLKMTGKLVPDEDLDALIGSFCTEATPIADLEPAIELAQKELEALNSLEKFLLKKEKIEVKKSTLVAEVDNAISKELSELRSLNSQLNESLENFSDAWQDLRNSQGRAESEVVPDDFLSKVEHVNKEIEENLNYHLDNDFKEISLLQGILKLTPEVYWLIYNRLEEIQNEVIRLECNREAISLFQEGLNKLEFNLNNNISFSVDQISDVFIDPNLPNRLLNTLSDSLNNVKECFNEILIEESKKCVTFLTDRLDCLSKIESILRRKLLYYHALIYIFKGEKVTREFQLEKLQECCQIMELYYTKFEQRMNFMMNHKQTKKDMVNQDYKKMMNDLSVKNMDLPALDREISSLLKKISEAYEDINKETFEILRKALRRLKLNKEMSNFFFIGPTREAFTQIIDDFVEPLELLGKDLANIEKKKNKISHLFRDITINEHGKKHSVWLKCLNNPEEFVYNLREMERELESLMAKNEKHKIYLSSANKV